MPPGCPGHRPSWARRTAARAGRRGRSRPGREASARAARPSCWRRCSERRTETESVLPQAATGPAWPVTRRSGSEYPSEEYDSNCRPSSCSRASRSVRRRARRSSRARRVSQGNTEHLPAAEGPRSLRPKRESRPDPPTSYTVKHRETMIRPYRLAHPADRELIRAQDRRTLV